MEDLMFDEMSKGGSRFYFKYSITPNFNNQEDKIIIEKKGFIAICGTKKCNEKEYYLTSGICNSIYNFVMSNACTLISMSLKQSPSNMAETGHWTNYDIALNGLELHITSGINTLAQNEKELLNKLHELCNNIGVNDLLECVNKAEIDDKK